MDEEDDWKPQMTGESILKAKVINFHNDIVNKNIEEYNSKPTPYQHVTDSEESQQEDKNKNEENKLKQSQNLYDPLDDEHQQTWVSKSLQKHQGYMRPLSCPGCFTPLCYSYKQGINENEFISQKVLNCNYNPYPVSANLQSLYSLTVEQIQKLEDRQLQNIGDTINTQQKHIDLKFQLQCTECQNIVGVYDAHQNNYLLTDLI